MSTSQVQSWLEAGIAAAKTGDRKQAYSLLRQVVDADEGNEKAWLWLSEVAETAENRRICLENVLTLNPHNQVAKRGLAKLDGEAQQIELADSPKTTVRKEYQPISAAAAMLYPDQQVKEWEWRDPTPNHQRNQVGYQTDTQYQDIWTQDVEMCAYCAHEVQPEDKKCSKCQRPLFIWQYRYPTPSSHMHVLWVLLLGVGQLYLLQGIINIISTGNLITAVPSLLLTATFLLLAGGVYFRQSWAHTTSIALLATLFLITVVTFLFRDELVQLNMDSLDPAIGALVGSLANGFIVFIMLFQLITIIVSLVAAAFFAGPDFERHYMRHIAVVSKGLNDATQYHDAAQRLAKAGMWATAVLHWQRAAAKSPNQISYQRQLGIAYAKLGFYQRSLDVLQSALTITTNPVKQTELQQAIEAVQQQITKGVHGQ